MSNFASPRLRLALKGAVCGLLGWFITTQLGVLSLIPGVPGGLSSTLGFTLLGAMVGMTRARRANWIGVGVLVAMWLVVGLSPLAAALARPLVLNQRPVRSDAVVVLLASIQSDDDFGSGSLPRTLHGLKLMRQGMAPTLILTQAHPPQGSHRVAAAGLMRDLKMRVPFETVGPVGNTHDEAVLVARRCRERGWTRILLVTSSLHSRRAALVFAKTGLQVTSTPCRETGFDLENLSTFGARVRAFSSALHEIVGLRAYRMRGWI